MGVPLKYSENTGRYILPPLKDFVPEIPRQDETILTPLHKQRYKPIVAYHPTALIATVAIRLLTNTPWPLSESHTRSLKKQEMENEVQLTNERQVN